MELFDRKLRFNPTGFYARYNDLQDEIIRAAPGGGGNTETIVENASNVTIYGAELEVLYQPISDLTFRGSFGYLGNQIQQFLIEDVSLIDPSSPNFDPSADPANLPIIDVTETRILRRAPEFTFSIGMDYTRQLNEKLLMTFTTNYSFTDEFATSPVIDALGRNIIDSDGSADFSLTFETTRDKGPNFFFSGFVNDAFDDRRGRLGATLDAGVFFFGAGIPTTLYGFEAGLTY